MSNLGDPLAVYDGRTYLGAVIDRGCGVDAVTAGGRDLGRFPNIAAASAAVLQAAGTGR